MFLRPDHYSRVIIVNNREVLFYFFIIHSKPKIIPDKTAGFDHQCENVSEFEGLFTEHTWFPLFQPPAPAVEARESWTQMSPAPSLTLNQTKV